MHHICALYQFATVADVPALREQLADVMAEYDLRGTLLVAPEGINGTIAGQQTRLHDAVAKIASLGSFHQLNCKWSSSDNAPFKRAKVRIKREIVTMGIPAIDPVANAGIYVDPADWNALLDDPQVIVIDTRNKYETTIGRFDGAIDPATDSFREFPDYVDATLDSESTPAVAMYCTGGIRCEKATALLRAKGFKKVYHLRGGILEYLRTIEPADSRWQGDCSYLTNGSRSIIR